MTVLTSGVHVYMYVRRGEKMFLFVYQRDLKVDMLTCAWPKPISVIRLQL